MIDEPDGHDEHEKEVRPTSPFHAAPLFDPLEPEKNNSEDVPAEETEINFDVSDDVSVELCCPGVVIKLLPCLYGGDSGTFWNAWNKYRRLGSRYTLILNRKVYMNT